MAFDAATGTVVLFGGSTNGLDLNDTWIWDQNNWTHVYPPVSPPARSFTTNSMAYSPSGRYVLMFGGYSSSLQPDGTNVLGDTWTWDGMSQIWTQRQVASGAGPSPRRAPLARDATGNVLLFGGDNAASEFGDTWIWNVRANNGAGTWQRKQPPTPTPAPRGLAALAYDPVRHGVVLFGGSAAGTFFSDAWIWKSGSWNLLTAPTVPHDRYAFGMAYDPRAQGVVMFGGYGSGLAQGDIWILESDIAPGVNVTPANVNFGEQLVGLTAWETVSVTNNGSITLIVTSVVATETSPNANFGQSGGCGTIAPGASCAYGVSFNPLVAGPATGTYTINFGNGVPPEIIPLKGVGATRAFTVVPAVLQFNSPISVTSAEQFVVVTNTGVTPVLGIVGITVASPLGPNRFALASDTCSKVFLPVGSSCTVGMTYTPTTPTLAIGNLTISTAAPIASQSVPLVGTSQ